MTKRTIHSPIRVALMSALCSALIPSATPMWAGLIAYTSFEEPGVFSSTQYTDTGDPLIDHALVNNEGQPQVNWTQVGSELGFSSFYSNTRNSSGLTDGDDVGVTSSTTDVGAYPHGGTQGFQMSDIDGLMTTTLDPAGLGGFLNPGVSLSLYVAETGWEVSDRIRIWTTVDGGAEIDLLNTSGQDIDDLTFEGQWSTLSTDLTGYTTATLAFELDSNAKSESIFVDHIEFTGDVVSSPVPAPSSFLLTGLGIAVVALWQKKEGTPRIP